MCTPPDLNLRYLSWVPIRPPNRNLRYQLNPSNLKPPITAIHRANSQQFTWPPKVNLHLFFSNWLKQHSNSYYIFRRTYYCEAYRYCMWCCVYFWLVRINFSYREGSEIIAFC